MRVQCDVCERHAAVLICCADEAALCAECDRRVHAANKVAKQHQRVPIGQPDPAERPVCDICQEKPAFFFCVEDRAILCRACDVAIHLPNSLSARHRRFLLPNGRVALEALPADVSLPQPPPSSPFACALAAPSPHSASAFNPAAASAPRPHPLAASLAASAAAPLPRPSVPASAGAPLVAPRPPASPPSRSASAAAVAVVPSSPTPPTNTAHAQARAAAATAAAAPTVPVAGMAGAAPASYRSSRKGNSAFASNPAPQGASRRGKADWGSSLATANHTAPGQLPGHVYAGSGASSLAGRSPAGFGGSGGASEFSFPAQAAPDAAEGLEWGPGKGRMGAGADALASGAEGAGAPSHGGRGGGGGGAAWAGEGGGFGGGGEMGGGEAGAAGKCEAEGGADWRVEELLNIPELAGGYTLADVGSSKAEAHDLGDFDWTADLSLFDEQMYAESLHEVPQIAPSTAAAAAGPSSPFSTAFSLMTATPPLPPIAPTAAAAGPSTAGGAAGAGGGPGGVFVGMGGRARGAAAAAAAASAMLPDADDCFVVPDVAAPVPSAPPAKRRRGIV